jgi:flagellar basal-body rod protein FlgG
MDLALNIAKSGLEAHHKNIEVISNNLANANTTGFKKSRAEFEDLPYDVIVQPGAATTQSTNTPSGLILGTGTKLSHNKKIHIDGPQVQTDNPLDLSIRGRGFIQVQIPNGSNMAYTRAGSLQLNEQGQLTLSNGYIVQPPINIPQGSQSISISQDGIVNVLASGATTPTQVGQIELTDFINVDGLEPIGENLYQATITSGTGTQGNPNNNGMGYLTQGALEGKERLK